MSADWYSRSGGSDAAPVASFRLDCVTAVDWSRSVIQGSPAGVRVTVLGGRTLSFSHGWGPTADDSAREEYDGIMLLIVASGRVA